MKKIAIIITHVAIGNEKGLNRLFYLSNLLCEHGYHVDLITSKFQHWTKSFRTECPAIENKNLNILLIDELGYKKNIDIKRILSEVVLANNIKKYLNKNTYDLVYCNIPDNLVSKVVGEYANKNRIPYVVDVEDLWPEAMRMVLDVPIISDILFFPFSYNAKKTYKYADAIVGSSDTYRDEPKKYGINIDNSITVYVGSRIDKFDNAIKNVSKKIKKEKGEVWITYAGSLGSSYDIKTLVLAIKKLEEEGYTNVKGMILGDGPLKNEFEDLARSINANVVFTGYLSFELMAGYLNKSDFVINSIVKKAPQSIPSKIGDYLAAGKPLINTSVDKELWNKVETDKIGVNAMPEDVADLVTKIKYLLSHQEETIFMGKNARTIAEKQFDRKTSYLSIVNLIGEMVNEKKK